MFDTEKFIVLISARPSIWDTRSPEHRNKESKRRDYDEIGREMYPEWDSLSSRKRDDIEREMQKKWKNVKDNFLRTQRPGAAQAGKKKYLYHDLLAFLSPTHNGITFYDLPQPDEDENGTQPKYDSSEQPAEQTNSGNRKIKITSHEPFINYPQSSAKIRTSLASRMPVRSSRRHDSDEDDDDDKQFMLSMLPLMKRMNPATRIKTRIELMQVIQQNLL